MRVITFKIDVTKIDKARLYRGKLGTYLNGAIIPRKEAGKYGDTHMIIQSVTKEERERGERGPIIGSATYPQDYPEPPPQPKHNPSEPIVDDVPF